MRLDTVSEMCLGVWDEGGGGGWMVVVVGQKCIEK